MLQTATKVSTWRDIKDDEVENLTQSFCFKLMLRLTLRLYSFRVPSVVFPLVRSASFINYSKLIGTQLFDSRSGLRIQDNRKTLNLKWLSINCQPSPTTGPVITDPRLKRHPFLTSGEPCGCLNPSQIFNLSLITRRR